MISAELLRTTSGAGSKGFQRKLSVTAKLLREFRSNPTLLDGFPRLAEVFERNQWMDRSGKIRDWDSIQGYVNRKFKGRADRMLDGYRGGFLTHDRQNPVLNRPYANFPAWSEPRRDAALGAAVHNASLDRRAGLAPPGPRHVVTDTEFNPDMELPTFKQAVLARRPTRMSRYGTPLLEMPTDYQNVLNPYYRQHYPGFYDWPVALEERTHGLLDQRRNLPVYSLLDQASPSLMDRVQRYRGDISHRLRQGADPSLADDYDRVSEQYLRAPYIHAPASHPRSMEPIYRQRSDDYLARVAAENRSRQVPAPLSLPPTESPQVRPRDRSALFANPPQQPPPPPLRGRLGPSAEPPSAPPQPAPRRRPVPPPPEDEGPLTFEGARSLDEL